MKEEARVSRLVDFLTDKSYVISGRDLLLLSDYDEFLATHQTKE